MIDNRTIPQAIDSENAVLAIAIFDKQYREVVINELDEGKFNNPNNRKIFRALQQCLDTIGDQVYASGKTRP